MILQKYDSYKDSGVEWLGKIPDDWAIKRIKDFCDIKSGEGITSSELFDEGNYEVYGGNGFIGFCDKYNVSGQNIIIGRVGAKCGNVHLIDKKKWISDNALILRVSNNYLFEFMGLILKVLNLNKLSISSAQPLITGTKVRLLEIPYLEKELQSQISNFLNKKTSQIDSKISLLQEKITSYEDLKKSIINETVCRGLNKNVDLKDSEIEWIGNIPKHWKVERLKNIFNERAEKNKKLDGEPITDNILSVMKDIGVINHRDKGNVGNKMSEDISGYKIVHPKDIVVNKMNVIIGSVGISKEYGALSVIYIILKTKPESHPEFYDYVFRSKYFQKYLRTIATGILEIREAVNSTLFKHQGLPNPPKDEQIQIANYLDEKTTKIDNIISKIKDQVNTLKEFRKTLINDVVTGKVRVEE